MTANDLIQKSIDRRNIVAAPRTEALTEDLRKACDASTETDWESEFQGEGWVVYLYPWSSER